MSRSPVPVLNRYLAVGGLKRSLAVLLLLTLIYTAVDIVEIRSLSGDAGGPRYLLKLPSLFGLLMPIALVLGGQLQIAALKKRGEWIAALSSGISPRSLAGSLLLPPAAGGIVAAWLVLYAGPGMLARWDQGTERPPPETGEWVRDGNALLKTDADGAPLLVIERDAAGRPTARFDKASPAHHWRASKGWEESTAVAGWPRPVIALPDRRTGGSPTVLPGATLTLTQLDDEIRLRRRLGHVVTSLEAERALRFALIAACLLLPLATLGLAVPSPESRASRLVAAGLVASLLYWMLAAAAWNAVAMGLLPPRGLSAAVPLLFLALTAAVLGLRRRIRTV